MLALHDNPGAPFAVTARLRSQNTNEISVRLDRVLPTSTTFQVYGTNFAGDDPELTVEAGERDSEWVTLTREDTSDPIYLRAVATAEWPNRFWGLQDIDASDASLNLHHTQGDGANLLPIFEKRIQSVKMLAGSDLPDPVMNLTPYASSSRSSGDGSLSYEVSSSDEDIVTVSTEDSLLTLVPVGDGDAEVTVTISDPARDDLSMDLHFNVMVDEEDEEGFNIDVVRIGAASREPLSSAIDSAVALWEAVLEDIESIEAPISADGNLSYCYNLTSAYHRAHTDDLTIIVAGTSVDGPQGTLAYAATCESRDWRDAADIEAWGDHAGIPSWGLFVMDEDDVNYLQEKGGEDGLTRVMVHEIGHILGIGGYLWRVKQPETASVGNFSTQVGMLSENPFSGVMGGSIREELRGEPISFVGTKANDGWKNVGGDDSDFPQVGTPVANTGRRGSFGAHWNEQYLDNELMTPYYNDGLNLFSEITVESMKDLGYDVNPEYTAEDYEIPEVRDTADAAADRGPRGVLFDLSNDYLPLPLRLVSRTRNGMSVDVINPPMTPEQRRLFNLFDAVVAAQQREMALDRDPREDR